MFEVRQLCLARNGISQKASRLQMQSLPVAGFMYTSKGMLLRKPAQRARRLHSRQVGCCPQTSSNLLPCTSDNVDAAVRALKNGNVIALPTDTLYGLAASAQISSAVKRLYTIKGRPDSTPLAICVADPQDVGQYGDAASLPKGLLSALLPGPVTLVLRRLQDSALSDSLNPGVLSIGVRVPGSDFIRAVARGLDGALALTSANISGGKSTTHPEEFSELWEHCEHVFDGGRIVAERSGSTIVDLTIPGRYKIIRDGSALDATIKVLEAHDFQDVKV